MNARDPDVDTCDQRYDEIADDTEYYLQQLDYHKAKAAIDCSDAILGSDEHDATLALITIGNRARLISETGDTDDKLAFVCDVCTILGNLIDKYAADEAGIDFERRYAHN